MWLLPCHLAVCRGGHNTPKLPGSSPRELPAWTCLQHRQNILGGYLGGFRSCDLQNSAHYWKGKTARRCLRGDPGSYWAWTCHQQNLCSSSSYLQKSPGLLSGHSPVSSRNQTPPETFWFLPQIDELPGSSHSLF